MQSSGSAMSIDHKETHVKAPRPRQLSSSKEDVLSAGDIGCDDDFQANRTEAMTTILTTRQETQEIVKCTSSASGDARSETVEIVKNGPLSGKEALATACGPAVESVDICDLKTPAHDNNVLVNLATEGGGRMYLGGVSFATFGHETALDHDHENNSYSLSDDLSQEVDAQEAKVDENEKEVFEYCPGLAIRSLTLQDLQDRSEHQEPLAGTQQAAPVCTAFTSSSASQSELCSQATTVADAQLSVEASSAQSNMTQMTMSQYLTSVTSSASDPLVESLRNNSATPVRKPLFNPIEVERKFSVTEDTEGKLKALGANLSKEKTITDIYFDDSDCSLMTSDCWIRRRNDCWEAKVPLKPQTGTALFAPSTQFKEISNEREISSWLVNRLGLDFWMRGDAMDLVAHAAGLTECARLTTVKHVYTLLSCGISLDLTDHGFCVADISTMAACPDDLPHALHTIDTVAQQLGVSPLKLV